MTPEQIQNLTCGDVLFDEEGSFSNGSPTYYQLTASNNCGRTWFALEFLSNFKDNCINGGASRTELYPQELERAKLVGRMIFQPVEQ